MLIFGGPVIALWSRYLLERERIRQAKNDGFFSRLAGVDEVRETSAQYAPTLEDALQRIERG